MSAGNYTSGVGKIPFPGEIAQVKLTAQTSDLNSLFPNLFLKDSMRTIKLLNSQILAPSFVFKPDLLFIPPMTIQADAIGIAAVPFITEATWAFDVSRFEELEGVRANGIYIPMLGHYAFQGIANQEKTRYFTI